MSKINNKILEINELLIDFPYNTYEQIATMADVIPEMIKQIDEQRLRIEFE